MSRYCILKLNRMVSLIVIAAVMVTAGCATQMVTETTAPSISNVETTYIVKKGDTLSKIAQEMTGDKKNVEAIANYNGISKKSKLKTGQQLSIPASLSLRTASSDSPSSSSSATGLSTQGEGAVLEALFSAKGKIGPNVW